VATTEGTASPLALADHRAGMGSLEGEVLAWSGPRPGTALPGLRWPRVWDHGYPDNAGRRAPVLIRPRAVARA
jgi:hypothetical protein